MRIITAALLCLATRAQALDITAPANGAAEALTPASVKATGCIQTPANAGVFNANCGTTNVGIGTASPQTLLDVQGAAQFGSTAKSTFTAAGLLQLVAGSTISTNGTLSISTAASAALVGDAPVIFLSGTSGRVGILTTTPASALDVNGTARMTQAQSGSGSASAAGYDFQANANGLGMYRIGADILGFTTASTERLRIDASGNLNLGNGTATASTMTAAGTLSMAANITASASTALLGIRTANPARAIHLSSGTILVDGNTAPGINVNLGTQGATAYSIKVSSQDASVTFGIQGNGVIISSSAVPTISCDAGTGVIGGAATNIWGTFTAGAAATNCTVTFSGAGWPNNASCVVDERTSLVAVRVSAQSKTAFTAAGTTIGSDVIAYHCDGN